MIDTQTRSTSDFFALAPPQSAFGGQSALKPPGDGLQLQSPFADMLAAYSDAPRANFDDSAPVKPEDAPRSANNSDESSEVSDAASDDDVKDDDGAKAVVEAEPLTAQFYFVGNGAQTVEPDAAPADGEDGTSLTMSVEGEASGEDGAANDADVIAVHYGNAEEGKAAGREGTAGVNENPQPELSRGEPERAQQIVKADETAFGGGETAGEPKASVADEVPVDEIRVDGVENAAENVPEAGRLTAAATASNDDAGAKDNRGGDRVANAKREKLKIEVRDYRGGNTTAQQTQSVEDVRHAGGASGKETEIIVEVKSAAQSAAFDAAPRDPSSMQFRAEKSLENFLARELHQNLNGDIVREAQVMLRNGGEGTIRLALRPESLGSVKIKLELAGNKISGKIIVESAEALRAFEREIASLEEAFREAGFDGASLDTALAGGNAEERRDAEVFRTLGTAMSAVRYDESVETVSDAPYFGSEYAGASINVFV